MYPTTNLQPGQRGPEVEKLQQFLLSQRLLTQEQIDTGPGIYGPQTTNAVKRWQEINGVDNTSGPGFWGPQSIGVASGDVSQPTSATSNQPQTPAQPATPSIFAGGLAPDDPLNKYNTETGEINTNGVDYQSGETQESVDSAYTGVDSPAANNPAINSLVNNGSTLEEVIAAFQSGDLSGITDSQGMPFSVEDQQKALADGEADNKLYYEALQSKETADAESAMAKQKADYQNYLITSGQQFEADKSQSDQTSANQGVLFSGGRVQKEKNLTRAYNQDQASALDTTSRNIGNTARDFQYKYGNDASNGLSSYYNLGGNTYNANVARGGVGSGDLSSVYNPSQYNYQGTRNTERSANSNQRAAGYLWNKGNKLLASSYNNQK